MRRWRMYPALPDAIGPAKCHSLSQCLRYYTLSIILGTVAFSYGSVPLYKMVPLPVRLPHLWHSS